MSFQREEKNVLGIGEFGNLFFLSILFGDCSPSWWEENRASKAYHEGIDYYFVDSMFINCVRSTFRWKKNIDRLEMSKRMIRKFVEIYPKIAIGLPEKKLLLFNTFRHDTFLTFVAWRSPVILCNKDNLEDALNEMTDRFLLPMMKEGRLGIPRHRWRAKGRCKTLPKILEKWHYPRNSWVEVKKSVEGTDFYEILSIRHTKEKSCWPFEWSTTLKLQNTNGTYLHPLANRISRHCRYRRHTQNHSWLPFLEQNALNNIALSRQLHFLFSSRIYSLSKIYSSFSAFPLITPLSFRMQCYGCAFCLRNTKGILLCTKDWEQADVEYQTCRNISSQMRQQRQKKVMDSSPLKRRLWKRKISVSKSGRSVSARKWALCKRLISFGNTSIVWKSTDSQKKRKLAKRHYGVWSYGFQKSEW